MVRWRSPISLTLLLASLVALVAGCQPSSEGLATPTPTPTAETPALERPATGALESPATAMNLVDARRHQVVAPKRADRPPASSDFSTLNTLDYSILREYERAVASQGRRIRYPVCVTAEFSITDAKRNRYRAIEEQAVNRWNDALRGEPGWQVEDIRLYLVGGSRPGSCPRTDNGLRVYELRGLANTDRGYAEFYNYVNAIGRREFDTESLRRELHEYGHQIGLGDTYTESSYQTPIGQPPGVMNLYFEVDGLTRDDIDGVRHIWWMIRNNSNNPCPADYETGEAPTNRNGHRFCVRLNNDDDGPDGDEPSACPDTNRHCAAWAERGECAANPDYMLTNCCASCRETEPEPDPDPEPDPRCTDSNANCAAWAERGECAANPDYMLTSCCASCRDAEPEPDPDPEPDPRCTDSNANCAAWAERGECVANPDYMLTSCCASCERANSNGEPACSDTNSNCGYWSSVGECSRNPGYMLESCCASCSRR